MEEKLSLLLGSEGIGGHGVEGMAPREVRLKWRQLGSSASHLGGSGRTDWKWIEL